MSGTEPTQEIEVTELMERLEELEREKESHRQEIENLGRVVTQFAQRLTDCEESIDAIADAIK